MNLALSNIRNRTEVSLSRGIVVLDMADVICTDINDMEVAVSYNRNQMIEIKKFQLNSFYHKKHINKYSVDFMRNMRKTCWIYLSDPTSVRFSTKNYIEHSMVLKFFVIQYSEIT